jgi:acyl-CoA synthetase (AMP-forming)/AMP-acid ligase II
VVVLEPGASLDTAELKKRVKAQLAAYKVPRHVLIAEHDALPFTDTGKIEKRRLRAILEARVAAGAI